MPWIWKYLMKIISLKTNFNNKHGTFLWHKRQVLAGVASTNGDWRCSHKSLIKSMALWSGFCEVKMPRSMLYAVRNVQEPTGSRDSLMCQWPPNPKAWTVTPQGFDSCIHTCLPQVPHIKSRTHTLCLCAASRNYTELYRVTLWIIMVWYTMLPMAQV